MKDIESRKDIELLLRAFYEKALKDDLIGFIFTDIAKIDLGHHLPIISDFWEMILFRGVNFQEKYQRSPMLAHIILNEKISLESGHFRRWLELFGETIDENFQGETAQMAKFRADSIADAIMIKIGIRKLV